MPYDSVPLTNGTVTGNLFRGQESDRLSMVRPVHREVAEWLLDYELRNAVGQNALPMAVERIIQKFFKRLAKVTSLAACQALLSRALHIPRAEFAFLEGIRAGSKSESAVEGLDARVQSLDQLYARAGLAAMLGTLIDLLASFIGQDLTLGMLREVWPELPTFVPGFPS